MEKILHHLEPGKTMLTQMVQGYCPIQLLPLGFFQNNADCPRRRDRLGACLHACAPVPGVVRAVRLLRILRMVHLLQILPALALLVKGPDIPT